MDADLFTTLVRTLQMTVATSLIFIGGEPHSFRCHPSHVSPSARLINPGLSSCLSLWVMPLTLLLPPHLAVKQFNQTVLWGFRDLQPSSRILMFSLITTVFLTLRLPDPAQAEQWKTWALAVGIMVPVAPYEVYCIFPINDRVKEIGQDIEKRRDENRFKRELGELFTKWQFRNCVRVGLPLVAGFVGWLAVSRG